MDLMEMMIGQIVFGGRSGPGAGDGSQPSVDMGSFTLASDSYQPPDITVRTDWNRLLIWTENSSLIGRRNISGAIMWVNTNDNLAYKVYYTNSTGSSGAISELLGGGVLYSKLGEKLSFGIDVSYGVYAANTTYKWIAWRDDE